MLGSAVNLDLQGENFDRKKGKGDGQNDEEHSEAC